MSQLSSFVIEPLLFTLYGATYAFPTPMCAPPFRCCHRKNSSGNNEVCKQSGFEDYAEYLAHLSRCCGGANASKLENATLGYQPIPCALCLFFNSYPEICESLSNYSHRAAPNSYRCVANDRNFHSFYAKLAEFFRLLTVLQTQGIVLCKQNESGIEGSELLLRTGGFAEASINDDRSLPNPSPLANAPETSHVVAPIPIPIPYLSPAKQFLANDGNSVHPRPGASQAFNRSDCLVAVMGPTGSGKSTVCNILCDLALKSSGVAASKTTYFEPSSKPSSFTKGFWLLEETTHNETWPKNLGWEVIDCEGLQIDQVSSWKLVMVLPIIAEIAIFCNRDARYDALLKTAMVFQRGIELSASIGLNPVTQQIFVQIDEGTEEEQVNQVIERLTAIVPHLPILPFQVPQIRNRDKKNHAFITTHDEIVGAVEDSVFQRLDFPMPSSLNAEIGGKDIYLAKMLKELNEGRHLDFLSEKDLNDELLRADMERIYLTATGRFQIQLATFLSAEVQRNSEDDLQSLLGVFSPTLKLEFVLIK